MKENPQRKIKITGHIYDHKAPTEGEDALDINTKDRHLSKIELKKSILS
jgi:hypothetical protein